MQTAFAFMRKNMLFVKEVFDACVGTIPDLVQLYNIFLDI